MGPTERSRHMTQRIVTMDELKEFVGQSFEIEFEISNDEVIDFEDVTRVTETYRDSLPSDYPAGMIEGFHTLSMLDYLGHRVMRPDPELYWEYNYGLDRVRFPSPLISGTPMTLNYEVVSAEPKDKGLLMKYRATVVSA